MVNNKNMKIIMDQGTELIEYYRQNPCVAAFDLCRADLAPIQRIVFQDMWFKNYVIGVMGRGCGKSNDINSLSFIDGKGLCYLYEEFPKVPSFLPDGETMELSHDGSIYTSNGFKPIKNISLEKNISGLKLKTKAGFENKGSVHHPLLTIDKQGNFYYKQLQEFKAGDYVCIQRGQNVFGKTKLPNGDAYLMGLFIGDGSIGEKAGTPSITISDKEIENFCIDYCDVNNVDYRIKHKTTSEITIDIYFKGFWQFFEKYNIKKCLSYHKEVPKIIRSSDKNTQINFLKGLFDTDGGFEKTGVVTLCSVSKKLIKEVQMMLLNFGIISGVRKKKTKSKFGKAFILTIGSDDVKLFYELIGFNVKYKQRLLKNSLNNKKLNTNKNIIPFVKNTIVKELAEKYGSARSFSKLFSDKRYRFDDGNRKNLSYCVLNKIINTAEFYSVDQNIYNKLLTIGNRNYYFDEVKSINNWAGDCYDFEMNMEDTIEPNYFSNGFINHNTYMQGLLAVLHCLLYPGYRVGLIAPTFRQSKMMFSEVEKLYSKSDIVRQACEKKPTRGTDTCFLRFKAVGGNSGSYIEALPLGVDGAKIRGSRFYLICIDELAQVPDKIIDLVIRPFASVSLEPMEKVRRLEQQKKLIDDGLATEDDFEDETINKMIMTSSGFFKFNHMWRRMKDHWEMVDRFGENSMHAVYQVPYWFMPTGFLENDNIEEAKRTMSSYEFQMEYEAAMISDSEGFFKASLLEECTVDSGFNIELRGDPAAKYVVGVDPNQGGSASCGILIIKTGAVNKIVSVLELKNKTTQGLTKAIQYICKTFNVIRIFMDQGGGGKAIMDLLDDGYDGFEPIIDRTDKDKVHRKGSHILEMINFTPAWIADANFATLSLMEDRRLRFPEPPISASDDRYGISYDVFNVLKSQILSIIVTQTSSGLLHFDTPKKGQNKDLYSALILAAYGVRMIEKEMEDDGIPILHSTGGMVRSRTGSNTWSPLDMKNNPIQVQTTFGNHNLQAAVLKKRIK